MHHPAGLPRINERRARDSNALEFVVRFGPARWPRVPPWRPRPPALPAPGDGLPLPDAGSSVPNDLPALNAPCNSETT